jgi:hypothetical protein
MAFRNMILSTYISFLSFLNPESFGQDDGGDLVVLPNAIKIYMYKNYETITSDIARRNIPYKSIYPCFTPISYRLLFNYDKENERAWLLNLKVGVEMGSGSLGIYRTVIMSNIGGEIIGLPESKSGNESLVLNLNNDQKMIIVRLDGGKSGSPVEIFLLQPDFREIFSIGSPDTDEGWYCTVYFKKFVDDVNIGILVNKYIIGENNRRRREFLMFRYDEKSHAYIPSTLFSGDQIKEIINKEGGKLPSIEEYGPPYEDHGKIIDK